MHLAQSFGIRYNKCKYTKNGGLRMEIVTVAGIIGLRAALTFLIHWEIKEEKNHS